MTDLAQHLKNLIRADGPISIATFMSLALTGRGDSYYRRSDPFGAAGDFITAPEISQIFGELIGLWCVDLWRQLGSPGSISLVELGPGRGTMMRDALRAARVAPSFLGAVSVTLIEVSESLRAMQKEAVGAGSVPIQWRDRFEDLKATGPVIVLANEFLDALPVRQFVRTERGWTERCVGLGADDRLVFGLSPGVHARLIPATLREAAPGAIAEISPARTGVARAVGERIAGSGGAALFIDYGYAGPALGDTLQAVRGHAFADALAEPGSADLTAHVDFGALAVALAEGGAHVSPLATQGEFLNRLGAAARVATLKSSATPAQAAELDAAYQRLTGALAMGSLFKVLAAASPAALQPAGFA
jgi:NADH dehydrogenase [ubiquinone] 1 alpha subcomplex assembly factor 7